MSIVLAMDGCEGAEDQSVVNNGTRGKPTRDSVFDGWLNHHLSRLYGPVLQEPLPTDLLRLLEEKLG